MKKSKAKLLLLPLELAWSQWNWSYKRDKDKLEPPLSLTSSNLSHRADLQQKLCPSTLCYILPGQDPKGPGCYTNHQTRPQIRIGMQWRLALYWPPQHRESLLFASVFQNLHTFALCQPWSGDIQEENSGKRSSCLGKVMECKAQEETHRLRVSWANDIYGHPPTTQQLLSPSLLNSELLSGSLSTYLCSFPSAAFIPPFSPLQSRRAGQKIFDCEVTERQSLNSVVTRKREKAGEGYALAILVPLYWNIIGQFRVLLGINAA